MSPAGAPEWSVLLNSLGIVGPNIRHEHQAEPDPKWDCDALDVWELTRGDQEWCICGRTWPCEAQGLGDLVAQVFLEGPPPDFDWKRAIAEEAARANRAEASALDWTQIAEAWGNVMDGRHIPGHETRIRRDTTTTDDWHAIAEEYVALGLGE